MKRSISSLMGRSASRLVWFRNQCPFHDRREIDRQVRFLPHSANYKRALTTTKNPQGTIHRQVPLSSTDISSTHQSLLQHTKFLLDPANKLDATDPELWDYAEHVLNGWLNPTKDYTTEQVHPLYRVDCSIRILDRLAASLPKNEMLFASVLQTQILHQLLKTWRNGLRLEDDNTANEKESIRRLRRVLTPSLLADKMDKYRWVSLLQPDVQCFNMLLHAATFVSYREGVIFADALLERLIQVSQDNETTPLMDAISVATVMQAWIRHGRPDKAEGWLVRLESWRDEYPHQYLGTLKPNQVMYATVLSGWAKEGNAERALVIFNRQLEDFQQGNEDAQPDTVNFNCALEALAKSKDHQSLGIADRLLEQMQEFSSTFDWNCAPDDHTWMNLLACYARHKPSRAERLWKDWEAEGRELSLVAYNTMLHGYAQAGRVDAALELLEKLESATNVIPDETSYNTVLSAYSKSKVDDAPARAGEILNRMRHKGIIPTTVSYSSLLQCWAKSNDPNAAERAESLLREMKQYPESQPNVICYNIVLSAWGNQARVPNNHKALEGVLRLFTEFVEQNDATSLRPTDVTFRTVLHAIAATGSAATRKDQLLQSLLPVMKQYGYRPSGQDEKLLRRLMKTPQSQTNNNL